MKRINKLLTMIGVASIPALSLIPMVSCGNKSESTIKPFKTNTYIIGDAASENAYFTSTTQINDDQTVEITSSSTYFTFGKTTIYTNNVIECPISRNSGSTAERKEETLDLTFKCKNSNGSVAWEQTLKSYKVVYSPGVFIDETQKTGISDYDQANDISYKTYEFTLETAVDEYRMKPEIKNLEGAEVTVLSSSNSGKKMTVTVQIKGDKEGVSQAKFDMLFICLDSHEQSVYTPLTMTGFNLTYMAGTKAVPETKIEWQEIDGVWTITSVDFTETNGYNTLELPAKHNGEAYAIKEGLFIDGEEKTTIPSNITVLKFNDITNVTLPKKCFKNAPFVVLNLKEQEEPAQSVDNVKFGTESLAFANAGAMGSGSIYYNDAFNEGTRVTLQTKLWYAGIRGPNWYGVTQVGDEESLRQAAWVGGNISLTKDITLTNPLDFNSTNSYLNLNGKKLTSNRVFYKEDGTTTTGLIRLYNSQVIVYDSESYDQGAIDLGAIKPFEPSIGEGSMAIEILPSGQSSSSLNIYGGTYYGNKTIVYNNGGTVLVKSIYVDGVETYVPKFKLYKEKAEAKWMFDCDDDSIKQGISSIKFSGGWFYYTKNEAFTNYYYKPSYAEADTVDGKVSNWLNSAGGFAEYNDLTNWIYKVIKE